MIGFINGIILFLEIIVIVAEIPIVYLSLRGDKTNRDNKVNSVSFLFWSEFSVMFIQGVGPT